MSGLVPRYKPKLPPYLSFPIGADAIGNALKDIPQLSSLKLVFYPNPIPSATKFRQVVELGEPHLVLSARFERWEKRPSISDEWQEYLDGRSSSFPTTMM